MSARSARRVIIAPDKFKGSLTAQQVADELAKAIRHLAPDVIAICKPIADGGEGTVEVALRSGYSPVTVNVTDPLGTQVSARYAMAGDTAVIEMSAAAGLARLPSGPTPNTAAAAATRGVGELIRDALDRSARRIVLGIGGSCSNDGGTGMVRALGARVLDAAGSELADGGVALLDVADLDLTNLDPRLSQVELLVAGDVDNPLTGPLGAAAVYGPQKGADPATVECLETALGRWADVVSSATGTDRRIEPGLGAGGGAAFGAAAVLGGRLVSGVEVLAELSQLRTELERADLLVVGEGSLDAQSLHGKGPVGVARLAAQFGLPAIAVVGRNRLWPQQIRDAGLRHVYALTDIEPDPALCIRDARVLLAMTAERISTDWLAASGLTTESSAAVAGPITITPEEWREAMLSTVRADHEALDTRARLTAESGPAT